MSTAIPYGKRLLLAAKNKEFDWKRFWAFVRLASWYIITIPVMVLLYVAMIAEGIRLKFPFTAIPFYKIKGMPKGLEQFDYLHRVDLALPASIGLLFLVWAFWEHILKLWVVPQDFHVRPRQKPEAYKRVVVILGVALLLFDSYMFYSAMTFMGWGGKFSATALLATIGYAAALISTALITINLRQDLNDSKKKETEQ